MSPKNSRLTVGLTALGLLGFSATRAANPVALPAPSGPSQAPAAVATSRTVLLLSDGQVLKGQIREEGDQYVVRQPGGEIRRHKSLVEGTFDSVEAVYRFKLSQTNERDPDDQLKLARWCMIQKLPNEAKERVKVVVALSPSSNEAKAMLVSLEAAEFRAQAKMPRVDPALVRTRAEMVESDGGQADALTGIPPAEIDAAVLRKAQREMGLTALPVIFDLPPPVAVKRAETYSRYVHQVLQGACAKCHNENYPGRFQLVEVKRQRDLTANALRANLDATLQLVDPNNLSKSELLSIGLLPHGKGTNPRPVFRGSNDPRFRVIEAWVKSLQSPSSQNKSPDGLMQPKFGPKEVASGGGGFASERGQPVMPFMAPAAQSTTPSFGPTQVIPSTRYMPGPSGQRGVIENQPPSADEFPVSPLLGGPKPRRVGAPVAKTAEADPAIPLPTMTPGNATPGELPELPVSSESPNTVDPAAVKASASTTTKPKKPVKIDPALLERALMLRNSGR